MKRRYIRGTYCPDCKHLARSHGCKDCDEPGSRKGCGQEDCACERRDGRPRLGTPQAKAAKWLAFGR